MISRCNRWAFSRYAGVDQTFWMAARSRGTVSRLGVINSPTPHHAILAATPGWSLVIGMATIGVPEITAEGCDLYSPGLRSDFVAAIEGLRLWQRHQHNSKLCSYCIGVGKNLHHLRRGCAGGYVEVRGLAVQQKIANATAY